MSRARATAWLRVEAPSFRYSEYACDLIVFGDRNSSAAISGKHWCVLSSGSSRSPAAVRADAPGVAGPRSAESQVPSA